MALYEAYFDESGTHDGSLAAVVGGYIVRSDDAVVMSRKWKRALDDLGLPFFHMVDCAHGAPPFDRLSKGKRIALEKRLITLIKRYTKIGIAAIIPPIRNNGGINDDVYVSCIKSILIATGAQIAYHDPSGKVAVFIEKGHAREAQAMSQIMAWAKLHTNLVTGYGSADKTGLPLLQAADFLAWQIAKYVKDKVRKQRRPREDYKSLVQHKSWFTYLAIEAEAEFAFMDEDPHLESDERDKMLESLFKNGISTSAAVGAFYRQINTPS